MLYGTELERCSVDRNEAGEGADCGRPRDQESLERADMVERSCTHRIYANGLEKSSVPGELRADMVERSSTYGIYVNGSEKSSVKFAHDHLIIGGHMSMEKTLDRVSRIFMFERMSTKVREYCENYYYRDKYGGPNIEISRGWIWYFGKWCWE